MQNGKCPKCSSNRIMERIEVQAQSEVQHLTVMTVGKSKGTFDTSAYERGEVRAWVCSDCGFTELYTENLPKLYEKYLEGKR